MSEPSTIHIRDGVRSRALDNEMVLYNPATDTVTRLDPVGAVAWKLLGEPVTLDQLVRDLAELYQMETEAIADDVEQLVDGLLKAHLVVNAGPNE